MEEFLKSFNSLVKEAKTIAIAGHIKPDGDCIGACFGMHRYLRNYLKNPEIRIDVLLDFLPKCFDCVIEEDDVITENSLDSYDLFICLDCGDLKRLGKLDKVFEKSTKQIIIDHHFTNEGFGTVNHIEASTSSTCEILCKLFDFDFVDTKVAKFLYLGIVHDTGVFKHSCTTYDTMRYAGMLISKGVVPNQIIDGTFYEKTYVQNQLMGRCLMESILVMDKRVIVTGMSKKMQDFYGVTSEDFEGIIDQLRVTKGVEVALVIREERPMLHKVSLRSKSVINVGEIAAFFGGGGHVRAAGCLMHGSYHDVINNLTAQIEAQYQALEQQ